MEHPAPLCARTLTPLRATEKQKEQHQVNWILTPTRAQSKDPDPAVTRQVEALLTLGDYAYVPHEALDPEQQEELAIRDTPLRQMHPQRIPPCSTPTRAHAEEGSSQDRDGGSCVKYAVYASPTLSTKFKSLVDENNPVVVISPVRRSVRHLNIKTQETPTKLRLLDALSELGPDVDYAWVPNNAILDTVPKKTQMDPFQ